MSNEQYDDRRPASLRPDGGVRAKAQPWVRNLVLVLGAVVAVILLAYLAAAFVPRWWAQRVGDQVDDRFSAGVLWGLFYGIVFTFVPLLVAWQARRPMFKMKAKLLVVVIALLLAFPNLITLGVVLGTGSGAHAGERIMDVKAPAFRGSTAIGAVGGGLLAFALIGGGVARRRRKHQVRDLRGELHNRDEAERARTQDRRAEDA